MNRAPRFHAAAVAGNSADSLPSQMIAAGAETPIDDLVVVAAAAGSVGGDGDCCCEFDGCFGRR